MMVVKTWSESTKEAKQYLKYNGYGRFIIKIPRTDYYICILRHKISYVADVKIVK